MSDSDQLSNSAFHRLRGSLSGVAVSEPPPVDAIMARGRSWRRHRRYSVAGLFLVGAAIAAALVVRPLGPPATGPAAAPAAGRTLGTIRTAAYKIVLNSDSTATLTINATELIDPAKLQSDLGQYGIPAKVKVGSFCTSDPAPEGLSKVVSFQSGEQSTITIDPTAMPAGTELSFGEFKLNMGVEMATYGLIHQGSYNCSSTLPTSSPSSGAMYLIGRSDTP
ncbi:MAG: hypothetical protein QOD46_1215 [Actinomycetota bacterium]|jgi:hypothetical protein|nr:hypothetical protein [Actinomycetota bacterium]